MFAIMHICCMHTTMVESDEVSATQKEKEQEMSNKPLHHWPHIF